MAKRRRRTPYVSGHCLFAHGQFPCPGEVKNGALITPRVTLCSCSCHGNYETRLVAAGQVLVVEPDVEEDEDD